MSSSSTPLLEDDHSLPPPPDAPSGGSVSRTKRAAQFLFNLLDSSSNGSSVSQSSIQITVNVAHNNVSDQSTVTSTTTTTTSGTDMNGTVKNHSRVVFLSDMHFNGAQGGPATSGGQYVCASGTLLNDVVRVVNAANADVIILGGDYVDADGKRYARDLAQSYLGKLRAKHGIYAVLGNHDQFVPGSRDAVITELRNVGIVILDNETVNPLPNLEIVGVGDCTTNGDFDPSKAFGYQPSVDTVPVKSTRVNMVNGCFKASSSVGGLPRPDASPLSCCRIIVTHNPDAVPRLMGYPAHVILAGHTHGGQVCVPFSHGRAAAAWLYEDVSDCCCCCCGGSWLKRKVWPIYRSFSHWEWSNGLHILQSSTDSTLSHRNCDTTRLLFVTNGIGSHSPGRFLCPPEVSIIDIDLHDLSMDSISS